MPENRTLPVTWLAVAEYMQKWLYDEYGSDTVVHERRVLSVGHLPGARKALRETTVDDFAAGGDERRSVSALRMDCLVEGMKVNPETMDKRFHFTSKDLARYVPIECQRLALTQDGVLRPWNRRTAFSRLQACHLVDILHRQFWKAVEDFDGDFAERMAREAAEAGDTISEADINRRQKYLNGLYPDVDMVTEFCEETGTPEMFIPEIRREFQRRRIHKRRREQKLNHKEC